MGSNEKSRRYFSIPPARGRQCRPHTPCAAGTAQKCVRWSSVRMCEVSRTRSVRSTIEEDRAVAEVQTNDSEGPDRRRFLQEAGLVGAGVALAESFVQRGEPASQLPLTNTGPDRIPHKPFGRTKETVSIMRLG